jgi:hypothetical protein
MAVVLLDPEPLHPPEPCVQFDPQPVLSQIVLPGASETCDVLLHLQGQFAQRLSEMTDPMYLLVNYQLDGPVHEMVVPPDASGAPGSLTALYNLTGKMTEALYMQGALTPSWTIQASIGFDGSLSGVVHPPQPVLPGSPTLSQEIDATFGLTTMLSQTETQRDGGQAWMVQATVMTKGSFSEICHPPNPCTESFSVHDQIQASVAALMPVGTAPGPATLIDAAFAAGVTLVNGFVPWPTPPPQPEPVAIAGNYQFAGPLQEMITPPVTSTTSAPTMESMAVDVTADGLFNQVSVNPQPLPP